MNRWIWIIFWIFGTHLVVAKDFQLDLYWNNHIYAKKDTKEATIDSRFYNNIVGHLIANKKWPHWSYDLDSQFQIALDKSKQHYLSVPTANISYRLHDIVFLKPLFNIY